MMAFFIVMWVLIAYSMKEILKLNVSNVQNRVQPQTCSFKLYYHKERALDTMSSRALKKHGG